MAEVFGELRADEERVMRGEVENERHRFAALRRQHGSDEKHVRRGFDDVDRTRAALVQRVAGQASPLQGSVGEEF